MMKYVGQFHDGYYYYYYYYYYYVQAFDIRL